MVRFSQMVVEYPWIEEIDLNPLLASSRGLLAQDARVLLHDASLRPDQLPMPAIRPASGHNRWETAPLRGDVSCQHDLGT